MITFRRTSLLDSPAQTLVNTVNCVGVMGKGLAKAFRDREPEMFKRYKSVCDEKLLEPGKLWLWRGTKSWVLNFPTKIHWRNPSKIEWVEAGLEKFVGAYKEQEIREVSFPRLGCGNGGLAWQDVRPLMEDYLSRVDIPVYIHDFQKNIGIPEHLESVSKSVAAENFSAVDFDSFLKNIDLITRNSNGHLKTLVRNNDFKAHFVSGDAVEIDSPSGKWCYDLEDLHGTWVALLRGMITQDRVEWSQAGGGEYLISLLSLLPNARPIEIERSGRQEYAVELLPNVRKLVAAASSSTERSKNAAH